MAAATALFYVVLCQVFRLFAPAKGKNPAEWGALLGAALWAVHPLRAEAVAWATASAYPLTAVGLLASFACYLKAQTDLALYRCWLVLAWVFAVAAYGSYPVGATYGLWLMAADRWLLSAVPSTGRPGKLSWNWTWVAKHAWFSRARRPGRGDYPVEPVYGSRHFHRGADGSIRRYAEPPGHGTGVAHLSCSLPLLAGGT